MIKENDRFRSDYTAMNLHDYDITTMAKEAGIEEGARKNAIENAKSLYANGASIELISKSLKMTEDEVRELTKDIVPVA